MHGNTEMDFSKVWGSVLSWIAIRIWLISSVLQCFKISAMNLQTSVSLTLCQNLSQSYSDKSCNYPNPKAFWTLRTIFTPDSFQILFLFVPQVSFSFLKNAIKLEIDRKHSSINKFLIRTSCSTNYQCFGSDYFIFSYSLSLFCVTSKNDSAGWTDLT